MAVSTMPEFALVNGSQKDLLITSLVCSFADTQGKGRLIPAQRLEFKESGSFILKSESAVHCKVTFDIPSIKGFVTHGKLRNGFYRSDMYIDISWVEMNGNIHKKSIKFITYGFREDGEIGLYQPLSKTIELYNKKHINLLQGIFSQLRHFKKA